MINAWELFNVLKEQNYEQLKDLIIVIEIDRVDDLNLGESRLAEGIEEQPSQIRIYSCFQYFTIQKYNRRIYFLLL